MKRLLLLLPALALVACTKETFVEGLVPQAQSFAASSRLYLLNGKVSSCQLTIEGLPYTLNLRTQKSRAITASTIYGTVATDSLLLVTAYATLPLEVRTGGLYGYQPGEQLSETGPFSSAETVLCEAIRKSPYTAAYVPVTQTSAFTLRFALNQAGYLAFKLGTTTKPFYGWVHLTIHSNYVDVDRYGYQSFAAPVAGGN
ncbi:MAG: hypothetical protein ACRYFX_02490 [Janthinobacterium lividum]